MIDKAKLSSSSCLLVNEVLEEGGFKNVLIHGIAFSLFVSCFLLSYKKEDETGVEGEKEGTVFVSEKRFIGGMMCRRIFTREDRPL